MPGESTVTMQPLENADTLSDLPSTNLPTHFSKLSLNGNGPGFSQGAFHSSKPSSGGVRDRLNGGLPSINTGYETRARGGSQAAEMQPPGTGYDMNYTPLLPSQLLMGSPFQPGSPSTFQSPQFQNFPTFTPMNSGQYQNQSGHVGSPVRGQQPMSPHYQSMDPSQYYGCGNMAGGAYGGYGGGYAGGYGNQMHMAHGAGGGESRTVYLGNIPQDTAAEELLGHVRSGQIESVRLLPDRNCAFISFLDGSSAVHFHSDAILKKLSIRGQDIKVGWGKPSHIPSAVAVAVQQSGASRNVYLGNLPQDISEEELREDLGQFGTIDTIKLVREKNIGFVHFLTISSAVKAVTQLPQEPKWQPPRRIFYGKDRCAYVSKTQQQNAAQYLGIPQGYAHVLNSADRDLISNTLAQQSVAAAAVATAAGGANNLGNRTIYLGNIHPETTSEEICNVVRGGLLHHIRYIPDKHICFVTFIDPTAAASFFALSNMQGLMIHNRRLKIGWGKHSQALPPAIALAVSGGASRNVYIGNIDESWTEERLRQDFAEYGEIELVNTLREKSCAFVNFTNIQNAIKAIEQVRGREEYRRFKINFGKDRCGNPPRQSHQNHQDHFQQHEAQQHQIFSQGAPNGISSPPATGMGHSHRPSQSPMNPTGSRPPGPHSQGSYSSQGVSPPDMINNHPLNQYLTHVGGQQQPQIHQPQGFDQLSPSHGPSTNGIPQMHQSYEGTRHPQQNGPYHGSSNSFSINAHDDYQSQGSTTLGGMLAPNARGAQHSRATSMPAFSQNAHSGPQHRQHAPSNSIYAMGGYNNLPNGTSGYPSYGLAIHADAGLPRWAEEEVAS